MTNSSAVVIQKAWRGYWLRENYKQALIEHHRQMAIATRAKTAINEFEELKKQASRDKTADIPSFTRGSMLGDSRGRMQRHKFTGRH